MCDKALNKKTFGIRNEVLLEIAGVTSALLIWPSGFVLLFQISSSPITNPKVDIRAKHFMGSLILQFLGYFLLQFCLMFLLCCASGKIHHWLWGSITIFHIFYLYNPWIAHCYKNSYPLSDHFELYLTSFHISGPIVPFVHAFITFILWRMSKVKPDYDGDEPYEVIYGGEESSTKKNSDESSV